MEKKMIHNRLLNPQRCRRVPRQFSWVDQRLVRDSYIPRCSTQALALYLVLITVADAQGLSYYSDNPHPMAIVGARRLRSCFKNPQPAQYGVKNRLKMLSYSM
jgi:hypothetical protein